MKFRASFFFVFLVLPALAALVPVVARAQNAPSPADKKVLHETLKNAPAQTPIPTNPEPFVDLPEEYIQEAQKYYARCENTGSMSLYYNCKCLASKFLDKRIQVGPQASGTSIALTIAGECADATKAAGYEYGECIKNGVLMPINVPIEDYCACYANTFAKLYEKYSHSGPGTRTFVHYQTQAYISCSDPESAKKLFPGQQAQ